MGCQASCSSLRGVTSTGGHQSNDTNDEGQDGDRISELQRRRLQFRRAGSSSTSSLTSMALKDKRKGRKKKRPYVQLSAQSDSSPINGMELTKGILGNLPPINEVSEVFERLIKDENSEAHSRHFPPPAPTPMPMSPGTAHPRSTMSRFLTRNKTKADESYASEVSQGEAPDQPPVHRRQTSNDNIFSRLPNAAALAALTSHKRQSSMDLALNQNTPSASVVVNNPLIGPTNGGVPNHLGASGIGLMSAGPPPTSANPSGHHRRQGSENMFTRIVRGGTLTPVQHDADQVSLAASHHQALMSCTTRTFRTFLEKENKETLTDGDLESWRQRVLGVREEERWTVQHMQDYLYSAHNQAKDVKTLELPMDMTRPLPEYFISTSHNTYLSGGQWVTTGSKVDLYMYARALRQGCRCLEIDVYDGPDGDPMVTHFSPAWSGGSITFLEVCALIAKEAFKETRGTAPLILNLENNMNKQSRRAAEILVGAFGSRILKVDDPEYGWAQTPARSVSCPSPADLSGRVLCRSKPRDSCEEYQNLIFLRNTVFRFQSYEDISRRKFYQTSSRSESEVKGALKKLPVDVTPVELHRRFINRVYPRARAYNSENFNPLPYWLLGFQLVALNFQTEGIEMDLNRCMFERNGGSGFVLKPALNRRHWRAAQTRMYGAIRIPSKMNVNASSAQSMSSRSVISRSVLSNGGDPNPSPSHGAGLRASLFSSASSRFRPFTETGRMPSGIIEPISAGVTSTSGPMASNVNGNLGHVAHALRRDEKRKSFMGVMEEALKNQDEDDVNEEDEDLPAPPPLTEIENVVPPLDTGSPSDTPAHLASPISQSSPTNTFDSLSTGAVVGHGGDVGFQLQNGTPPLPPFAKLPPSEQPSSFGVEKNSSKKIVRRLSPLSRMDSSATKQMPLAMSTLTRTISSQSSDQATSDSPDLRHLKGISDTDSSDLFKTASVQPTPSGEIAIGSGKQATDMISAAADEEKKRRARARRRSTGSILKPFASDNADRENGGSHSAVRKRSLEDPGDLLRNSPGTPMLGSSLMDPADMDEEIPKDSLSSVLIRIVSVQCNVKRERSKPTQSSASSGFGGYKKPSNLSQGGSSLTGGGSEVGASEQSGVLSGAFSSAVNDEKVFPDEEVYVELVVDGFSHDRVERRTVSTVQLRGTEPSYFEDPEDLAVLLNDSETALFTIRLVDSWESNNGQSVVVASRSFFAHCVLNGTRDLILLGESSSTGYPIPYTVRCHISPTYAIYSKITGKRELESAHSELPMLSCPSKLAMIHCVILGCRSELSKLKLQPIDPFVCVQVFGAPLDAREVRTPRVSRCIGGKSMPLPKASNMSSSGSTMPRVSSLGSGGIMAGAAASADDPHGETFNTCKWMFPLVMTFAWSEFAFLRFSLRSHSTLDLETGAVLNNTLGTSTRRRGSIMFSKPTPAINLPAGQGSAAQTSTASILENGFVVAKNMLWADALRPGYRSIPLFSEKNSETHVATLLCHFTLFSSSSQTFGPKLDEANGNTIPELVLETRGLHPES